MRRIVLLLIGCFAFFSVDVYAKTPQGMMFVFRMLKPQDETFLKLAYFDEANYAVFMKTSESNFSYRLVAGVGYYIDENSKAYTSCAKPMEMIARFSYGMTGDLTESLKKLEQNGFRKVGVVQDAIYGKLTKFRVKKTGVSESIFSFSKLKGIVEFIRDWNSIPEITIRNLGKQLMGISKRYGVLIQVSDPDNGGTVRMDYINPDFVNDAFLSSFKKRK